LLKKIALIVIVLLFSISSFAASSLFFLKKKRLAIVIDDMGYDVNLARGFERLNLPLAFSFLPDAPYSTALSSEFAKNGFVVMIHMPSQPVGYPKENPGKDAIYTWTTRSQTFYLLNRAKKRIPDAVGLNNHMGSKILKDRRHLDYIMDFLKENKMFFIDSATIVGSLGCREADRFGVPCQRRRVFLDDIKQVGYIKKEIERAIKLLDKYNNVVAIGHCNVKTLEALNEMKPQLKKYLVNVLFVLQ